MTGKGKGLDQTLAHAAALQGQNRLWEAEKLYEAILQDEPRHYGALFRFGLLRLRQGRFSDAETLFRRAVKSDRKSADAEHHLAIALTGNGEVEKSIAHYRKALALRPRYAEVHNNLGYAFQRLDRHDDAARHCREALTINKAYPEAHTNLGNALQGLKRHDDAIMHYRQALALQPNYPEAHIGLAAALSALDRNKEAIACCEAALALAPRHPEAHINLANALSGLGQIDAAIAQYEKLLEFDPSHVHARMLLGQMLFLSNRPGEALAQFEQVLTIAPDDIDALNNAGNALRALGRLKEAIGAFDKAIALSPRNGIAYYNLAISRRFPADDPHFFAMKKLSRNVQLLSVDDRIGLHFGLAKIFAEHLEHGQAFQHLSQGSALKRQQLSYDESKALGRFEAVQRIFSTDLIEARQGLGDPSPVPVFIIGMPRSGTTLVEQVLASHPRVFGAGELHDFGLLADRIKGTNGSAFPEAVPAMNGTDLRAFGSAYVDGLRHRAPEVDRITDKLPANFIYAGLIHLVLPQARIIHVRRDLRDVALSCYATLFAAGQHFTYDLAELGRYMRAYRQLMAHWRKALPADAMLEIDYEAMVDDLAGNARRIVDYCGLEWDDAVLDFHEAKRSVQTASVMQVRQPIYKSSVGRWRAYEKELTPLLQILAGP